MSVKKLFFSEFERIANKKNILAFVLFVILSLSYISDGISEYNFFLEDLERFKKYETESVEQYISYEIYGAYGFRITFLHSPMVVFFQSRPMLDRIQSNISIKENSGTNKNLDGRAIIKSNVIYPTGFSYLFILLGSIYMFYMGLTTIKGIKYLRLLKNLKKIITISLIRWSILTIVVIILFLLIFLYAQIKGVVFLKSDVTNFINFLQYSILLLSVFFSLGLLAFSIKIKKSKFKFPTWILWALIVLFIPAISSKIYRELSKDIISVEKINLDKLKTAQKFERRAIEHFKNLPKDKKIDKTKIARELISKYAVEGYIQNKRLDKKIIEDIQKVSNLHEMLSLISPVDYYLFLSKEVASEGFYSNLDYLRFINNEKENFFNYYIKKRYDKKNRKVESFIKSNENIFSAKGFSPKTLYIALSLLLFYIFIISVFFVRNVKKIIHTEGISIENAFNFKKSQNSKIFFVYCSDVSKKDTIFYSLNAQEISLIDQFKYDDFDLFQKLKHLFNISSSENSVTVYNYLREIDFDFTILEKRIENVSEESLKEVLLAIIISESNQFIVLNNFLKGMSKEFENRCRNMLEKQETLGKTIIYLGSNLFETRTNDETIPEELEPLSINIKEISLR